MKTIDDFNAALDVVRRHDDFQSRHDLRQLVAEIIEQRDKMYRTLVAIREEWRRFGMLDETVSIVDEALGDG